jgi:hypothetical protein
MSSCDDSSCTCCRAALCASATSDFSLTDNAPPSCRSASNCFVARGTCPRRRHCLPRIRLARSGTVRSAAEPCRLSSVPPSPNFSSDLRLIPAGAQHESTSPGSNLSRASARTQVLCLAFVRMQYGGAIQTLRSAAPRSFSLRPATETQTL